MSMNYVHMLLDLVFKHITLWRNSMCLVSSRYRRVRKMQLHLGFFALFIYYTIFKEDKRHL